MGQIDGMGTRVYPYRHQTTGSNPAFGLYQSIQDLDDRTDADTKVSGLRHGASCCWGIAGISRRQRWQAQAFTRFMLNIRLAIVHMY